MVLQSLVWGKEKYKDEESKALVFKKPTTQQGPTTNKSVTVFQSNNQNPD